MAATATDYSAKCDRLGVLRGDLKKRQEEAEAAGKFTPEGKAKWDELCKEFAALKEDVLGADALTQAKQFVHDCDLALDAPRKVPTSPEEIEADLTAAREDILLRRTNPSEKLRFYRPHGETREGMSKNRKSALLSGLGLLTQVKMHGDWARAKLAQHGINAERLAQISPFAAEDGQSMGGYLVFPEFERTLIDLKEQYGVLGRSAYKMPMNSDTLNIPRRAGGTTVYYPEENTLIPASAMAFSKVMLLAKKYAQLALWSSELDEDSVIAFTDLLTAEMAYQFSKAEDFNGAQGDGTSAYAGVTGFLQALVSGKDGVVPTASIVTPAAGNGTTTVAALAAATAANGGGLVTWNKLMGLLPIYAEGRAKFYMHKTVFWQGIAPIIEAAGGNIAMYLVGGLPLKFLGYDVEMMQAMPNISQISGASATPALTAVAVLGDMLMTCYMGQRREMKVITSNERFMEYDQLAIQVSQRVAINNVVGDSVAPTLQAGPMVALTLPAT